MLDPQDRHLLLEALRPPDGYDLSFAIGTTYTLDLLTLLTAPLGFTIFELAGAPGAELTGTDAVRLLSALRRYADRIWMFCEAGRIAVPPKFPLLLSQLEQSVVPVRPPEGGSFHPKLWVLRYESKAGVTRYRVLCMTRNLTFDRSWDTMLVLDGEMKDRKVAFSLNHPIADFVHALPGMAITGKAAARSMDAIQIASEELRRVHWELPEPFDSVAFWPLGIPGYKKNPFAHAERALVISPFLSVGTLAEICGHTRKAILVSRSDALDLMPRSTLESFDGVYAFDPDVTAEQPDGDESTSPDPMGTSGLHAKLYILERGWDARIISGSANATTAAFTRNVEFLTELVGRRSKVGIDVLLATEKGSVGLRDVLKEYPVDTPPTEVDEVLEKQRERLDNIRRMLGAAHWTATIECAEKMTFRILLAAEGATVPADVRVLARPVLLTTAAAQELEHDARMTVCFETVSFESLTAFFALDVQLTGEEQAEPCQFVVQAQLIGEPEGRRERIAQYLLRDRDQVVQLLLTLLATDATDVGGSIEVGANEPEAVGPGSRAPESTALLEPLLRALDRTPERLDEVSAIVEDLKKTEKGRSMLPPGFEVVWEAIWQVREAFRPEAEP